MAYSTDRCAHSWKGPEVNEPFVGIGQSNSILGCRSSFDAFPFCPHLIPIEIDLAIWAATADLSLNSDLI
jgi:hypothetical protein